MSMVSLRKFATVAFDIDGGCLKSIGLVVYLNGLGMTCTFADVKSGLASIQNWLPEDCIMSALVLDGAGKNKRTTDGDENQTGCINICLRQQLRRGFNNSAQTHNMDFSSTEWADRWFLWTFNCKLHLRVCEITVFVFASVASK